VIIPLIDGIAYDLCVNDEVGFEDTAIQRFVGGYEFLQTSFKIENLLFQLCILCREAVCYGLEVVVLYGIICHGIQFPGQNGRRVGKDGLLIFIVPDDKKQCYYLKQQKEKEGRVPDDKLKEVVH
jgi:hypothetical protein